HTLPQQQLHRDQRNVQPPKGRDRGRERHVRSQALVPLQLRPMALDRRIDTEVAGYRIVEQLGRGGTSVVYRAEHVRLGRTAALKLLTPAVGEADFRERFLRESKLAADRKSTRLNSSHQIISYAVFCLKKKKHTQP